MRRARHRRFRELFARGRLAPRVARRLLQSKHSASTTCEPKEPALCARTPSFRPMRDPQGGSPLLSERRSRVVTGQGLNRIRLLAFILSTSRRACAHRELCPNPIGARTPPVADSRPLWPEKPIRPFEPARRLCRFHDITAPETCFRPSRAGPPHTRFREDSCAPLHPRCLPSPNLPSGEGLLLHILSPACGVVAWRLCYLRS
jgi:hypothetical protein